MKQSRLVQMIQFFDLEKSLGQAIEGANASLDNEHEPLEEDLGPSAIEVVADEEEVVPAVPSDSDLLKKLVDAELI